MSDIRTAYLVDQHPEYAPDAWGNVYKVGIIGKSIVRDFNAWWDANPGKRGVWAQPRISASMSVNDCASWLNQLLATINPAWRNSWPVIVDINTTGSGFGLDQVYAYRNYIKDKTSIIVGDYRLLLRVNYDTWEAWVRQSQETAGRLLDVFDILLAQYQTERPSRLSLVGVPKWWEYAGTLIKNDPSGEWATEPPGDEPPGDEPPGEEDPPGEELPPVVGWPKTLIVKTMDGTAIFKIEVGE